MRPFNRKLLRDLRRHLAEVLGVVIIVAMGITLFTGMLMSRAGQRSYIDGIYRDTRYEDFEVLVDGAPPGAVEKLRAIPGVEAAEARQVRRVQARVGGKDISVDIVSLPPGRKPAVDDPQVWSGAYDALSGPGTALAEYHVSNTFAVGPGDKVEVGTPGRNVTLELVGVALSPEYLRPSGGDLVIVGDQNRFGVLFVSDSEAVRLSGTESVNSFVARVRKAGDVRAAMREAESALGGYKVLRVTTGAEAPGTMLINFDLQNEGTVAVFFGVLLLWVSSLAVYVALTRMISSQQREIGAARALGYTSRSVAVHYLTYGVAIGVIGGALGCLGGYFLSRLFIRVYIGTMGTPPPGGYNIQPGIMAGGILVATFFSAAGAAIPALRSARMKPAEAMRIEAGLALKPARPGAGPGWSGKLPSWGRMTVRNLVRNRRRTVLTCVATTFALAALICAAAAVYSIDRGLDRYMNQINKWDISARFSGLEGMSALDRVKAVPGVDGAEPMLEFPARLVAGNVSTDVDVRAFESGTRLHGSFPSAGSPSTPGRGQILLNNTIAKELGVKRGSRVSLTTAIGTLPVEVAGTIEEPMGGVSYMDLGYLRSLAGQDVLNVVVAKVAPGHSEAAVAREVGKVPGVAQVDTRQQNKQLMDKLLGSLKPFMNLIFLLVLAIAFAVVLTTATVNALERTQEFATMRTLGSGMGRVTGLLSAETFGIGLICLVPGVLLGLGMQWLLITRLMSSSLVSVPFFFPDTALELWLPVFLLVTILAGVIPTRGIAHLDLARVTKERAG